MLKNLVRLLCIANFLFCGSCISSEKAKNIDPGYLNQSHADFKNPLHSNSTPFTGLRSAASGASVCSACAK
jgi:hypothetical protein